MRVFSGVIWIVGVCRESFWSDLGLWACVGRVSRVIWDCG